MAFQLPHIISWSHRFATEILAPGDFAVDLTAGRGRDTLELWRAVGDDGRLLVFDIQEQALSETKELLREAGCSSCQVVESPDGCGQAVVALVRADHANLADYLTEPPRVVIANLGYLPGGDHAVTTLPESTRTALSSALTALQPGGRLICVLYTAHPGGHKEAEAVEELLSGLSSRDWFVLRLQVSNRHQAPYLLVAEKR